MSPTGQKSAVAAEELVGPPIEWCPGVDAIVDVSVVAAAEVHKKPFNESLAPENVKFRGAP